MEKKNYIASLFEKLELEDVLAISLNDNETGEGGWGNEEDGEDNERGGF